MGPAAAKNFPDDVRVLIADDHRLFAEAVSGILAGDDRIEVVGIAGDGRQAVELAVSLTPDVTLMDISMPMMDGFEATRRIRAVRPNACVLMLTGSDASEDVSRALAAGAAGYVTKDRLEEELVGAILDLASR
jgi:two-component system, NarL family, nitrate/nitrite response regulator NarL